MIRLDRVRSEQDVQRNFEKLEQLVIGTGERGVEMRFGATSVTWGGASVNSNTATVPHGLGKAPFVAFCQGANDFTNACVVDATDATNLSITCRRIDGTTPGAGTSITVYWLVLG